MALDYKSSLARYRRYLQVAQDRPLFRASLFVVFSLILLVAMLVLALRPTMVTIAGLLGQIQQQKEVSKKLNDKIILVQEARANIERIRPQLVFLDQALPTTPEWSGWMQDLQQMASESGLTVTAGNVGGVQIAGTPPSSVTAIKEEKTTLPNGISGISFTISLTGQYQQLRSFLSAVEGKRRLAVLTDTKLSRDASGVLSLTVSGLVGYLTNAQP